MNTTCLMLFCDGMSQTHLQEWSLCVENMAPALHLVGSGPRHCLFGSWSPAHGGSRWTSHLHPHTPPWSGDWHRVWHCDNLEDCFSSWWESGGWCLSGSTWVCVKAGFSAWPITLKTNEQKQKLHWNLQYIGMSCWAIQQNTVLKSICLQK